MNEVQLCRPVKAQQQRVPNRELNLRASAPDPVFERPRADLAPRQVSGPGPFDLYRLYMYQERQEALVRFFRKIRLRSLNGLRILDVGCGSGGNLRRMADFGAVPANCYGIDPCAQSVAAARELNPNMNFLEGSGEQLPFPGADFDVVFQFTVFTSVLDTNTKKKIVAEIHRVLRPGGYFIWYDFIYSNPANPNVRGISKSEISDLLKDFQLSFRKVTLAPPIGRAVVKVWPSLYWILRAVPLLRTHYFCFAQKPPEPSGSGQRCGPII